MSAIDHGNFIITFFEKINSILDEFVHSGYGALAEVIMPALLAAFTLYIAMLGFSISQGWVEGSMKQLTKVVVKFALVYLFCINWGVFSQFVLFGIQGSTETLGMTLMNATLSGSEVEVTQSLYKALQHVAKQIGENGAGIWAKATWRHPGPYFTALIYWAFGLLAIFIAVIEIAGAQILLSLALAAAPLFIGFTIFQSTQGFFDKWLGVIASLAFTMIFVSTAVSLVTHLTRWVVDLDAGNIALVDCIVIAFVGLFGIKVITSVTQMAQSIGGAVTSASSSSMLAGAVGGVLGGIVATYNSDKLMGMSGMNKTGNLAYSSVGSQNSRKSTIAENVMNKIRKGNPR